MDQATHDRIVSFVCETDGDLPDTEEVPLFEEDGIDILIRREVPPDAPDAWVNVAAIEKKAEGMLVLPGERT